MIKLGMTDVRAEGTITDLLLRQACERPDAVYGIFPDRTVSFGALHLQALAYAKGYVALGVRPGDHIATLMPNCADWLPAYYGGLYAGAVVVALNARYKRHELSYTLAHSQAKLLVTTDAIADHVDFVNLLRDVLPGLAAADNPAALALEEAPALRATILYGGGRADGFLSESDLLRIGGKVADADVLAAGRVRRAEDTAAIIYTSGTTAYPKGCELSHRGIQNSWSTFAGIVDLRVGETVWTPMPFYHTGGIGPITAALARGAAFMTQPHYEPDQVVEMIERHRIGHLYPGFPQLSFPVVEHSRFDRRRFDFVRSLLNVGPPAMQERLQALLPDGAALLNLFGMTEGSGIVTFTPFDAPFPLRAETSGLPPPHTEIRIADPQTGTICGTGEPGEIQFRGGGAFNGYFRDPKATRATILDGGWIRSGDRGRIGADGYLVYLGRLKDMLKVGGENVAASEIEAFIQKLPQVRLVQVIGAPDDRMGEVPVAFVELVEGEESDEATIIASCEGQLARWKIPRAVVFVDAWPMSTTKVQKFRLAELLPEPLRRPT